MKLIKLVGAGLLSTIILTACGDAKPTVPADHTEQVEQAAAVVDEIRLKRIDDNGGLHFKIDGSVDLYYIDKQTAIEHGIDGLRVGNVIEVISDSGGAFKEVARQ